MITSEWVRNDKNTTMHIEKRRKDICAHCSPLSGSKITNSGLILLVFLPLRIGRKPPRCWGSLFLKCIAIFEELATTFIITIVIIINIIIQRHYHQYYHPTSLSSSSSSPPSSSRSSGLALPQDRSCSCFQSLLLRACRTREMTFKVQKKNTWFFHETVRKRSWKNSQLNQWFNIQVC